MKMLLLINLACIIFLTSCVKEISLPVTIVPPSGQITVELSDKRGISTFTEDNQGAIPTTIPQAEKPSDNVITSSKPDTTDGEPTLSEEDANDLEYEVEVLKESDQVYIELGHVPTRGYRDGIIDGSVLSNVGFDTSTLAIITVIETDEGLYFPKPSMDNPITKILNNQFTSRFYTDQEADFQVPSILLYVVDKSYSPDMQIKSGQDWALSQVTIDAFKAVSMAAIKINRF